MEMTIESATPVISQKSSNRFLRGSGWGLVGGLVGTLTMDLVLMGVFLSFGQPALTCFSIVGNTVARFLSIQTSDLAGTIRLGVITHYLVGPLVGVIFGGIVSGLNGLRVNNLKKCILAAVLYVDILSQPLLVMTPIMIKMTKSQILQWYGGSTVMHLILAVVLGTVVCFGLKLADPKIHKGS